VKNIKIYGGINMNVNVNELNERSLLRWFLLMALKNTEELSEGSGDHSLDYSKVEVNLCVNGVDIQDIETYFKVFEECIEGADSVREFIKEHALKVVDAYCEEMTYSLCKDLSDHLYDSSQRVKKSFKQLLEGKGDEEGCL
jgi:hypothetical protein